MSLRARGRVSIVLDRGFGDLGFDPIDTGNQF